LSGEITYQFGIGFKSTINRKISFRRRKISGCIIVDETLIKVGSESIWLWVAIESKTKRILALNISKERNMLVVERFIAGVVKVYGKKTYSFN
jgi:putative transposase